MKNFLWMSSAAVVIGAIRVNIIFQLANLYLNLNELAEAVMIAHQLCLLRNNKQRKLTTKIFFTGFSAWEDYELKCWKFSNKSYSGNNKDCLTELNIDISST